MKKRIESLITVLVVIGLSVFAICTIINDYRTGDGFFYDDHKNGGVAVLEELCAYTTEALMHDELFVPVEEEWTVVEMEPAAEMGPITEGESETSAAVLFIEDESMEDDEILRWIKKAKVYNADEEIIRCLWATLTEHGICSWMPYAIAQIQAESSFRPDAENKNGKDKGLLQYRIDYWDNSRGDIFDWRAQIDRYVEQVANRLKSGLSIEETISRHYTSDYVTEVNEKYVADVLQWYGRIEEE